MGSSRRCRHGRLVVCRALARIDARAGPSIVKLPADADADFEVYINGVRQQPYTDFYKEGCILIFDRPLRKAHVSRWRQLLGAWRSRQAILTSPQFRLEAREHGHPPPVPDAAAVQQLIPHAGRAHPITTVTVEAAAERRLWAAAGGARVPASTAAPTVVQQEWSPRTGRRSGLKRSRGWWRRLLRWWSRRQRQARR